MVPGGPIQRPGEDTGWTQGHTVSHCVTQSDTVLTTLEVAKAFFRPSLSGDQDRYQVTRS